MKVETEYAVRIKASGRVTPVSREAGERFASQPDGSLLELLTRTVTTTDWERASK